MRLREGQGRAQVTQHWGVDPVGFPYSAPDQRHSHSQERTLTAIVCPVFLGCLRTGEAPAPGRWSPADRADSHCITASPQVTSEQPRCSGFTSPSPSVRRMARFGLHAEKYRPAWPEGSSQNTWAGRRALTGGPLIQRPLSPSHTRDRCH